MQSGSGTPQPTPTSLPPAMMATQAELEAAVAALPAKRRRLREALDRLVACSPVPVPLCWEDLDAHLAAVAARFGGHFELESSHDASAAAEGPATAHNLVEHRLEKEEEEEEEEAANASADQDDGEDEAEEGELPRPRTAAVGGGGGEAAPTTAASAVRAGMDPSALVDLLCVSGKSSLRARRELLPALLGSADPHALIVRAVGGFLALSGRRTNTCWGNCVALIECAPRLAAPAAGALEEAEWVARDWKEMVVGKPWSCRDIGRMAGWGLLVFLASYNIVLEFDAEEITRLFDNVASQMKNSCVDLCKRLGLIEKMTDSINHFIENGQPLDAIRLARTFNLTHKYPPLTIMNDYIENAKKTAEDILSKESYTLESLNQVVAKKINALIFCWSAIDGCNIDPVHRNTIKTEITHLLHKYANKQQCLAGVSAIISTTHQQHNFQEQYHQKLLMPLEEQRRQRLQELQQMPEEEPQHQQQKPHEMQQQHPQNRQEQGCMWQNQKRRKQNNKNCKRKQRRQKQQELNKRPRLSSYVRPGIHNQRSQPFSGMQRAPFAAHTRPLPYFGS